MRHARNCKWCAANLGECPDHDRPNYSSPASASPKSRDVQGGPPSPEIGEMQDNKKMTDHELYNKAVMNDWDGRQMLLAIAAAREEGRQEERARWLAWATDLGYGEQELQWLLSSEDNK